MRRIIVFDHVSADGYFTTTGGSLDWVVPEEALDKSAEERLGGADAMLFGRKTYEMFASFWPNVVKDSGTAPDPHTPGRRSAALHAMGVWINDTPKIVYSRTLNEVTWKSSRVVREFDPAEVAEMKQHPGKDIMVFGSGSIVSLLTEHGLVDDYRFVVSPTLLGSGRSLIGGVPNQTKLTLVEATPYPSGVVVLHYTRA